MTSGLTVPVDGRHSPRLLLVLYNAGLTGGARITRALAGRLKERLHVEAIVPSAGKTTEWLDAAGIGVEIVPRSRLRATLNPLPHLKYLATFAGTVAAYRRVIRLAAPDIVHLDCLLNIPALVAARLSGSRTLLHLQEIPSGLAGRILGFVAALLADRVVAVSEAAAKPLRGRIGDRLTVVYNGTNVHGPVAPYDPNGWVSFIGKLSEDKDPISFVRAAGRIYEREPRAKFMICGLTVPDRAHYEARLYREIRQTPVPPGRFVVLKDRESVSDLLAGSSAVVSCSHTESFGLAALEAMAAGRPVVVPGSGAFPEYVTDGETGLLYSLGNIEQMAGCVVRLLRDPALAEKIGLAARALVEQRFREEQMADAMEEQYRILLARPRKER